MANSDKNIVITPNTSQTAVPTITFTGFDATSTSLKVNNDGSVYFEGTNGELLEVSNTKTGNVLEYGDSSGAPLFQISDVGSLNATNFDVAGKNKIIGGSMEIWQRGTTGLTSWACDRFQVNTGTWQRDTDAPPGFPYSLATTTNPISSWLVQHAQELPRQGFAGDLTGYWTLSFWAKYELGKEFYYGSWFADAIGGGNQVAVSNYLGTSSPGRFVGTGQWQRYTYTFNITASPGATNVCLRHTFLNLTGATSNLIKVAGFQFEKGTIATPFSRAGGTYTGELQACQRYYQRLVTNGNNYTYFAIGSAQTSSVVYPTFSTKVTMRTTPSQLDISSPLTTLWVEQSSANASSSISSITLNSFGSSADTVQLIVNMTSGLLTQGGFYRLLANNNSNAFIGVGAEL